MSELKTLRSSQTLREAIVTTFHIVVDFFLVLHDVVHEIVSFESSSVVAAPIFCQPTSTFTVLMICSQLLLGCPNEPAVDPKTRNEYDSVSSTLS